MPAVTDTSVPTSCSPLKGVSSLANAIKGLKGADASDKIFVAGIFGWPLAGPDGQPDLAKAEPYKVDLIPNPNTADTAHPQVYDYWPVCYDPDHRPAVDGSFDVDSWGWGAAGGLRHSAFVDEFGENGRKVSICERDFSRPMAEIGGVLARKLESACVPSDLEQGKTCTANRELPIVDAQGKVGYAREAAPTPKCADDVSPALTDCYTLASSPTLCPGAQYLVQLRRTADEMAAGVLPEGTRLRLTCSR
jgi:hypothetical protein